MPTSSFVKKAKKTKKTDFVLRNEDLERALHLIKSQNDKKNFIDALGRSKKTKILDLCSRDPAISNRMRPTIGGRLSNTQQLLYQLNGAVLKHDWSAVATCVDYLLNLNGKLLPVIWKSVFLVLLHHRDSNEEKIDNFLQMCLGLRTESDKVKYLQELLTLPRTLDVYGKRKRTSAPETSELSLNIPEDFL